MVVHLKDLFYVFSGVLCSFALEYDKFISGVGIHIKNKKTHICDNPTGVPNAK
jgi:hypothetical protein